MARRKKPINFDFSSLDLNLDLSLNLGPTETEFLRAAKLSYAPVAFENAQKMAESIDLDKDYFVFTSGKFIFGDFVEALCHVHQLQPRAIYLTTLGMSRENVDSIVNLVDYLGAEQVKLIVSSYFAGVERHKLIPYMVQEFAGKPIDVAVLQSHCKIALLEWDGGQMVIAGSANLSSSNNVEQFQLIHDPALFQWLRGRLDEVMERFTVIRGRTGETIFENNRNNMSRHGYEILKEGAKNG